MGLRRFVDSLRRRDAPLSPAERMVAEQVRARGVRDERVLAAMATTNRALFVPADAAAHAWEDRPIPIGPGATISQPYIVAAMTELLDAGPAHRVLEVGTGSGYQAAILARLVGEVYSIERVRELSERAEATLRRLRVDNVHLRVGDGTLGWPDAAPFDRIIATAAAREVPPTLVAQLADGGVLVAPVGEPGGDDDRLTQSLVRLRRRGDRVESETVMAVRFVPMVAGEEGGRMRDQG